MYLQSRQLESLFIRFFFSGGTKENSENLPDFQPDSPIRADFRAKIDFGSRKAGGIARRQKSYKNQQKWLWYTTFNIGTLQQ